MDSQAQKDVLPQPWMSSLAGIVANAASCTLHPLENVKLRFQAADQARNNPIPQYKGIFDALRTMYQVEGIVSLYRGCMINIIAGSVANSLFFYMYADGKARYGFDAQNPNSWTTILISLRAGTFSMACTTPMWVVKTRLALHRERTVSYGLIWRVVRDMAINEGPQSFFKGIVPSLFLSSYGVIQMYCYENINYLFGFQSGQKLTWDNFMVPFFVGGLSKTIASASLMPINVVKEKGIEVPQNVKQELKYSGVIDCATKMFRNEGISAFYKGLTPNMLKVFPSSGLFFLAYEMTLLFLQKGQNTGYF